MIARSLNLPVLAALVGLALYAGPATAQVVLETEGRRAWIVEGDYLYWALRSPGKEYGVSDIGGVQDRGANGGILAVDSEYSSGFRLAIGRRMGTCCEGGPEILFKYTDFDSAVDEAYAGSLRASFISSDNSENDDSDDINTLGVETITPEDRATSATARQVFDYQVYDLEIGQSFILSDSLSVRLSGGGRAAVIDSRFDVTYTGGDFSSAFSAFQQSDYSGGGLVLGSDLRWLLTRHLRMDIGANMGMMLGHVSTRTFIPDDEPGVPTDVTFSETRMTPTIEMKVALNYEREIHGITTNLAIGYEFVNWFNLSDTRTFSDSHMEAQNTHLIQDVSLDGLFARVGINY